MITCPTILPSIYSVTIEPPILFRVDATPEIGLGHLRRCVALAQAIVKQGARVCFLCVDDPAAREQLAGSGLATEWLDNKINTPGDVDMLIARSKALGAQLVIIDSYSVDEHYFSRLRVSGLKIVYFEDDKTLGISVDGVINGSVGAEVMDYEASHQFLGTRFLVLAPEYTDNPGGPPQDDVSSVLVTMGGIDHYNLSEAVIDICNDIDRPLRIDIVIGPYYENIKEIEAAAQKSHQRIDLHYAPSSLCNLMRNSGMAVSAGGSTLYELAAMRIPTVAVWLWENQRCNVEGLGQRDALVPLAYEANSIGVELNTAIRAVIDNRELRCRLVANCRDIIDGHSSTHLSKAIVNLHTNVLSYGEKYERGT